MAVKTEERMGEGRGEMGAPGRTGRTSTRGEAQGTIEDDGRLEALKLWSDGAMERWSYRASLAGLSMAAIVERRVRPGPAEVKPS